MMLLLLPYDVWGSHLLVKFQLSNNEQITSCYQHTSKLCKARKVEK